MKELNTTGNMLVGVFVIITFSLYTPFFNLDQEIRNLMTASTFLFGIFAGFVIASRLTRYSRYRELLTNETGYLITLYQYALTVDKKYADKIAEAIEKYLLKSFKYKVYEYHEKTEAEFYNIFNQIKEYHVTEKKQKMEDQMFAMVRDMLKDREELFLLGKDKINFWLKTILMTLSGAILFSLFLTRSQEIYSNILVILLATSVLGVLFLINDLDKLKLYNKAISYDLYYRVFDAIHKERPKILREI